ncbi:flagellar motor switch phosphatase FliY [Clostridium cellulovorans]|uniref:CheC, inhibitor of MCP methylation / FliN fusion protein n=1 Tax=Clostridium cellulovorans (strain ATCC 35296 / DSM 3052 / OCM 3 / 743B) TaxID=573061 RepID=D9SKE6_CLOC7|nr:flagellar motor switch phosphatase FliY [Clostridium cellulovorans]ADL51442.1 CheC, inhibitor of MCP methylation / FliN fusion protein [Clostridium cellulovorans 743B]
MNDGFLSQDEIDSLLNGGESSKGEGSSSEIFSDLEKDLLGEIGNISMGSASTALSQIINQPVNITTPVVTVTTLEKLKNEFTIPNIALDIKYISGIKGENLLVMKTIDASVIANLMMGGDGKVENIELSELEVSAVQEAMNQMIGSAATSMATMLSREINISPPDSKIWNDSNDSLSETIDEKEDIIKVAFKMTIGDLVDSTIMQIYPLETSKNICSIMMGEADDDIDQIVQAEVQSQSAAMNYAANEATTSNYNSQPMNYNNQQTNYDSQPVNYNAAPQAYQQPVHNVYESKPVEVSKATFQPLRTADTKSLPNNIDLIMDVPLNISVVLGKTRKSIKDILSLNNGSLIELDKLAEEPVEILVNGKKIAYGEVVVVDENFGVRITSIVSSEDRIKSLGR